MTRKHTYSHLVQHGYSTSLFHLSLLNDYQFNVHFMITFSSSSPWMGLLWINLRANVLTVETLLNLQQILRFLT
jgi:hypothetical protein